MYYLSHLRACQEIRAVVLVGLVMRLGVLAGWAWGGWGGEGVLYSQPGVWVRWVVMCADALGDDRGLCA